MVLVQDFLQMSHKNHLVGPPYKAFRLSVDPPAPPSSIQVILPLPNKTGGYNLFIIFLCQPVTSPAEGAAVVLYWHRETYKTIPHILRADEIIMKQNFRDAGMDATFPTKLSEAPGSSNQRLELCPCYNSSFLKMAVSVL